MSTDYRDLPTITNRSFDVSFYEGSEPGTTSREVFGERVNHRLRRHLRAFVNTVGSHDETPHASGEDY